MCHPFFFLSASWQDCVGMTHPSYSTIHYARDAAVTSSPPHPVCLRTRSRRVACVRCDLRLYAVYGGCSCNTVNTVPYRVVTYRDNGMPSKKKKYNARFPAVSESSPFYSPHSVAERASMTRRDRKRRVNVDAPNLEPARRLDSRFRYLLPQWKNVLCFFTNVAIC